MRKIFLAVAVVVGSCGAADAGPIRNFINRVRAEKPVRTKTTATIKTVSGPVVRGLQAVGGCTGGVCYPSK